MNTRYSLTLLATASIALAFVAAVRPAQAAETTPAQPAAAQSDSGRPEADTKRDADRKPADMVKFAGIKPGDKVVDFIPGSGYFTRVFSRAVGPKGTVYALVPQELLNRRATFADAVKAIAADPAYQNVKVVTQPAVSFVAPEPVDVIWTSQNYHDMHIESFGFSDIGAVNKALFNALKPGGVYIVLDHAAAAGSGTTKTKELHRIDPAVVKAEVVAAGFVFDGESAVLHNPNDPLTAGVFDPSIRGKTDQFIYKFRKPGR